MTTSLHATPTSNLSAQQVSLGVIGRLAIICLNGEETVRKNIQMKILKKIVMITDEPRTVCVHETLGQSNPSKVSNELTYIKLPWQKIASSAMYAKGSNCLPIFCMAKAF